VPQAGPGDTASVQYRGQRLRLARAARANDRAGEVGRTLNVKDFDLERIFVRKGADRPPVRADRGAIPETGNFCLELARAAKKHKTRVSFDLNYALHSGRGGRRTARHILRDRRHSGYPGGNEEDFQLCLGIEGPEPGARTRFQDQQLQEMISRVKKRTPTPRRSPPRCARSSASTGISGAPSCSRATRGTWSSARDHGAGPNRRPGTRSSAGFSTPCSELESEKWIQFGWAAGAMATTFLTDYAQPRMKIRCGSYGRGMPG